MANRRRHTRSSTVSWARRWVDGTGMEKAIDKRGTDLVEAVLNIVIKH